MAGLENINQVGIDGFFEIPGNDTRNKQADGLDFAKFMDESIEKLNQTIQKSADMSNRYAAGEDLELHDVMLASQESGLAMDLTMQMRNKILEIYREVIRMPI